MTHCPAPHPLGRNLSAVHISSSPLFYRVKPTRHSSVRVLHLGVDVREILRHVAHLPIENHGAGDRNSMRVLHGVPLDTPRPLELAVSMASRQRSVLPRHSYFFVARCLRHGICASVVSCDVDRKCAVDLVGCCPLVRLVDPLRSELCRQLREVQLLRNTHTDPTRHRTSLPAGRRPRRS